MGINSINYDPRKARVVDTVDTVDRVESHWICEGKPKSRIGKAIAPPPDPKPNVQQPQTTANSTASGMPSAASSATSQADYDKLKPQGSQGPISTS